MYIIQRVDKKSWEKKIDYMRSPWHWGAVRRAHLTRAVRRIANVSNFNFSNTFRCLNSTSNKMGREIKNCDDCWRPVHYQTEWNRDFLIKTQSHVHLKWEKWTHFSCSCESHHFTQEEVRKVKTWMPSSLCHNLHIKTWSLLPDLNIIAISKQDWLRFSFISRWIVQELSNMNEM